MKTETHSGVRIRNYVLNFNERIPSIDSTINISRENIGIPLNGNLTKNTNNNLLG